MLKIIGISAWNERHVVEWLHTIRCGQYEALFKGMFFFLMTYLVANFVVANHFNGDNLIECDQKILREIGINKVGDRVRLSAAIKQLRKKAVADRNRWSRVG